MGNIFWPSADSQWLSSNPFLTASHFHRAVTFVLGIRFGDVFSFHETSRLYYLQHGPHVRIVQLFRSQSGWILAGCD